MADIQQSVEELEKTEQELEAKKQELEKVKSETEDYETKKSALEQELKRVQELIRVAREEKRNEEKSFINKLREENFEKAKAQIIKDFGYDKPEAINSLVETFKKIDDDSITEDKIYQNLLRAHLLLNSDKYIKLEKEFKEMRKSAAELNANLSTSAAIAANQSAEMEEVQLTKEDIEAAKWAGIPVEKYKELKARGKI